MESKETEDIKDHGELEEQEDSEGSQELKEPPQKKKKQEISMPKKSKFRMRAHINPLSEINYPRYIFLADNELVPFHLIT